MAPSDALRATLGAMPDLASAPDAGAAARPWTLSAVVGIVSAEALVEAVAVSGRSSLTVGLRVGLVLCISLKWLFSWRVLHRSHGAALGLFLLQGTTLVAALGAVDSPVPVRAGLGAAALASLALLAASLHAFPEPQLPTTADSRTL